MIIKNNKNGAIAITTVVVTIVILLLGGITLLLMGVDLARSIKSYSNHAIAKFYSDNCLEESLFTLVQDIDFIGLINVTNGDSSCDADVSVNAGNSYYRDVSIVSTYNGSIFFSSWVIDVSDMPFRVLK